MNKAGLEPSVAVTARIFGHVQGVWYRAWTVEQAAKRGLDGWVRNCADGTVEALFYGPANKVSDMVEACHEGPPAAQVREIQVSPAEPPKETGFSQVESI